MQVQLIERLRAPGGIVYMPGEIIGVTDDEAREYVARGWAALVAAPDVGRPLTPPPVSETPPVDKSVKREQVTRK